MSKRKDAMAGKPKAYPYPLMYRRAELVSVISPDEIKIKVDPAGIKSGPVLTLDVTFRPDVIAVNDDASSNEVMDYIADWYDGHREDNSEELGEAQQWPLELSFIDSLNAGNHEQARYEVEVFDWFTLDSLFWQLVNRSFARWTTADGQQPKTLLWRRTKPYEVFPPE